MEKKYYLGIDIGSTTFKAVLIDDKSNVCGHTYKRTKAIEAGSSSRMPTNCNGRCHECGACNTGALKNTVDEFLRECDASMDEVSRIAVTGSQIVDDTKKIINYDIKVSEVSAHVAGAQLTHPECKAIVDVGGQDSKAMMYDEEMGMWISKMSGICAAGTGAFLDSVANKLNVPVEEMASKVDYDTKLEFSSVCAVLSATSINKHKSSQPIGKIIAGACKAQARTIMSGVGEILFKYKGPLLFQGGVAYNPAVSHYLHEISGNEIIIPEYHSVMGALGCAALAKKHAELKSKNNDVKKIFDENWVNDNKKSIALRAKSTRREFFSKDTSRPLVWRNLFYPAEILNAFDVRILTMETYAALYARNQKRIKSYFDVAGFKGYSSETCSFLRVLEGMELPKPDYAVSTSEPCQQGERIFADLSRDYNFADKFHSVQTPITHNDDASVETIAEGLERSVWEMEKGLGKKLDMNRLAEACELSNQAQKISQQCTELRLTSPPLIRGSVAVYNAIMFSQLWGKPELVEQQQAYLEELTRKKEEIEKSYTIEDTHRLIWLHLPPFYDTKLLNFIEDDANAPIVYEETNNTYWEPLDSNDPYRSLSKKLLTIGFLDPALRVKLIIECAKKGKLNGAVLHNHGFGRCSMADASLIKHLKDELKQIGIPLLVLDGDCMDHTIEPCSTYTKIESYAESLNKKVSGNIFGMK